MNNDDISFDSISKTYWTSFRSLKTNIIPFIQKWIYSNCRYKVRDIDINFNLSNKLNNEEGVTVKCYLNEIDRYDKIDDESSRLISEFYKKFDFKINLVLIKDY